MTDHDAFRSLAVDMSRMMTKAIAYAAGRDVANRAMRKAGRKKWSREDYNAACAEVERLMPFVNCNYTVIATYYELRTRGKKCQTTTHSES